MNTIVATTGGGFEDRDDVFAYLGAAVGDLENPLPANPAGEAQLEAAVAEVSRGPAARPVPRLPEIADMISGKTYTLEPNPIQMLWIRLDFDNSSEATVQFEISGEPAPRTIPVGLDGILHTGPSVKAGGRGS
jgi:hypothetical protein